MRFAHMEDMKIHSLSCGAFRQRPERYRWYEAFLTLLFLRPFRCLRSGTRFIRFAGVPRLPHRLVLK
jgi:hypothetical protein